MSRRFELAVMRGARARQLQLALRGIGTDDVFVRSAASEEPELEQHPAAEAVIPFDVADHGFRSVQVARDRVGEERCRPKR